MSFKMPKKSYNARGDGSSKYKDIYSLLEKLSRSVAGPNRKHRELLRQATTYISNCPTALTTKLPYDEATLLGKISMYLYANSAVWLGEESRYSSTKFLNFYEHLLATHLGAKKRNTLLTFLYYMADSKYDPETERKRKSIPYYSGDILHTTPSYASSSSSALNVIRSNLQEKSRSTFSGAASSGYSSSFQRQDCDTKLSSYRKSCNYRQAIENESVSNTAVTLALPSPLSKFKEEALNDDLVQNAIYSFTGIKSAYLKKDVITGRFRLTSKARSLTTPQICMLMRLSELGNYHAIIQAYTDSRSGFCAIGFIGQGFIAELNCELTRYYGMVSVLQEQLLKHRFVEQKPGSSSSCSSIESHDRLTLLKLVVWAIGPVERLKLLANLAEACQEKKGGALASIVYDFLINGDKLAYSMTKDLLLAICGPLYTMLQRWLFEGEIEDAHGEFFIECFSEVGPDRLWHDKYRIRSDMLPTFISIDLAKKILVTGKSINFLCEVCGDKQLTKGREKLQACIGKNAEDIFTFVPDTKLHTIIDSIYLDASKRVLDIVMGPHKLMNHLHAMRRYLLLGQGDFVDILMEHLKSELEKPAKDLYSYDLTTIMDLAIRTTNAQFDDPEIIDHLDVRLLAPCDGDIGWDILSLQYTVQGPLATMLEPSMSVYQILFKPLWRMKHMQFMLSRKVWKDQICNAKLLRPMAAELKTIIYRLYLYTSEMVHFIHQMQYYILFEVIECSWSKFLNKVRRAKALDDILNAHNYFLESIRSGAFIDKSSGSLSQNMDDVYEGIIRLETWQDKFYDICFKEIEARKQFAANILASESEGKFGVNVEMQLERDQERKIFEQTINSYYKSLENIGHDYEKAVRCFLLALNSSNDSGLQLFGMRLDFNEYYKRRDQRLCVPLTFEHMRLSSMYSTNRSILMGTRYSIIH